MGEIIVTSQEQLDAVPLSECGLSGKMIEKARGKR